MITMNANAGFWHDCRISSLPFNMAYTTLYFFCDQFTLAAVAL